MNAEPFSCPAIDALRQHIAEADAVVAKVSRFAENAASARAEAAAAEAKFVSALDDSSAVEFIQRDEIARVAEALARAAASDDVRKRRFRILDSRQDFMLVTNAAEARVAAIKTILKAARTHLAGLVSEEAIEGYETQRRIKIDRVRFELIGLEQQLRSAEMTGSAARQRVGWIDGGRNPMSFVPQHERSIDGFVALLAAPLPEGIQTSEAIAVEVVSETTPIPALPATFVTAPDENPEAD
jgi:hypothetical protein